jgi:hypothetical protein
MRRPLDCYVTYAETIETSGIKRNIPREAVFEIYQEEYGPPLGSLVAELTVYSIYGKLSTGEPRVQ